MEQLKNYYLKGDIDLSTCVKNNAPQKITINEYNKIVLELENTDLSLGDDGTFFKCTCSYDTFQINYSYSNWILEIQNGSGLLFCGSDLYLKKSDVSSAMPANNFITQTDLSTYALKTEIPEQYFTLEDSKLKSSYPIAYDVNDVNKFIELNYDTVETQCTISFSMNTNGTTSHVILKK